MSKPIPEIIRYEIGIVAVSSVGSSRYSFGSFGATKLDEAMEVLAALNKLPRPFAASMGGPAWWVHDGDMLFVAPMKNPTT